MNNDDILTRVREETPDLIYVAIGCARNAEQQCPPQVHSWTGHKLCILIDPILESPPLAHSSDNITVIPVYRNFEWAEQGDNDFIRALCRYTMTRTNAHMIVQDYTGTDIYPYYPGPDFSKRVLFDITYSDGGCYVDFSTVQILRDAGGDFIQPHFTTLTKLARLPATVRKPEVMKRRNAIINYLHYYYRTKKHGYPPEDWLFTVERKLQPLVVQFASIYNQWPILTLETVRVLLVRSIQDLSTATGVEVPSAELTELIESPERNVFGNAIGKLCELIN